MPDAAGNGLRVLVADDHELVRASIRALLNSLPGIRVVGEAANGREAVARYADLQPDVVLMDLQMPEMGGLEATSTLARRHPGARVLVLSVHAAREYVARALEAGAVGYLWKGTDAAELQRALEAAHQGRRYVSPRLETTRD
jgi:NarL family two-component system response regulator LiaR